MLDHQKQQERKTMPLRIQRHINHNKKIDSQIPINIYPYEKLKFRYGKQISLSNTPIYGVYYICCIGEYKQIVKEQLTLLQQSGLLSKTQILYCFICQYNPDIIDILHPFQSKLKIISTTENLYEKYALENFRNYIPSSMIFYYMYYFHTKGVSRDPIKHKVFHDRRQNLDFFILKNYEVCIFWLDNRYDAVGTSLSLYPSLHFSGNFWWTTSQHLDRLPKTLRHTYYAPEMYICSYPEGKYISVCQSTNNKKLKDYNILSKEDILRQSTDTPIKNIACKNMHF